MSITIQQTQRGVTLIELLVVVAILGIISGIAIPKFMQYYHQSIDKRVVTDMRFLALSIGLYQVENEIVPQVTDILDLVESVKHYSSESVLPIKDAWGSSFYYNAPAWTEYTLKSFGKDVAPGKPATTDYFNADADVIVVNGQFVASHGGTTVIFY